MKIPLHLSQDGDQTSRAAQAKVLEHDILAARKGDWNAKHNLTRTFMPLITSLAEKRAKDNAQLNKYIEAGKAGLLNAVRKYKSSIGADKFQIFALDYIEAAMDRQNRPAGILSRLFGGKS
jgi:DNA-directed RNA polymerase specialized sigma subunit